MEQKRCHLHGLVAAADGRCVICRRNEADGPSAPLGTTTYLIGLVSLLVVAGAAIMIYRVATAPDDPVSTAVPEAAPEALDDVEPDGARPAPRPKQARPTARRPDARPAAVRPEPIEYEIGPYSEKQAAAMKQVVVKMYSTPWCDYCTAAKRWAKEHDYQIRELDIEKSETDRVLLRSVNPTEKVPTFDVDGEILIGFSASRLEKAIADAAAQNDS